VVRLHSASILLAFLLLVAQASACAVLSTSCNTGRLQ